MLTTFIVWFQDTAVHKRELLPLPAFIVQIQKDTSIAWICPTRTRSANWTRSKINYITYVPEIEGSGRNILCFKIVSNSGSGIAQWYSTGLRAGWSGVRVPAGAGNFSLHHSVQTDSGAHPAFYPMGTRDSSPGVKRPGREADHWHPSSAGVKNAWSYTSTSQYPLMVWCSVKAQRQLYLLPYHTLAASNKPPPLHLHLRLPDVAMLWLGSWTWVPIWAQGLVIPPITFFSVLHSQKSCHFLFDCFVILKCIMYVCVFISRFLSKISKDFVRQIVMMLTAYFKALP
jgi:hypothetical protein